MHQVIIQHFCYIERKLSNLVAAASRQTTTRITFQRPLCAPGLLGDEQTICGVDSIFSGLQLQRIPLRGIFRETQGLQSPSIRNTQTPALGQLHMHSPGRARRRRRHKKRKILSGGSLPLHPTLPVMHVSFDEINISLRCPLAGSHP